MYSYKDRIRAVELYIKLGKRVRPTIRQLGYPTKNSLKGWYNEYQQKLNFPAGYAGRQPRFSQEQKEEAIEHCLAHDRCIAATVRALGYPSRGILTAWVREALPEARRAVVGSLGRQRYSKDLMQAGVMALYTRENSAQAVADKLGVCRPTLYNWKNQLLGREAPEFMKRILPVVHSDRGGHYRWPGWLSRMGAANLTRSMSRKACSPDNAACEGFFGRLENELFYQRDWKHATFRQFIETVDSYIRWYNEKRIKVSLGSLSPIEYWVSLGLAT